MYFRDGALADLFTNVYGVSTNCHRSKRSPTEMSSCDTPVCVANTSRRSAESGSRMLRAPSLNCPVLEALEMQSCPGVMPEVMMRLAEMCPQLRALNISGSSRLTTLRLSLRYESPWTMEMAYYFCRRLRECYTSSSEMPSLVTPMVECLRRSLRSLVLDGCLKLGAIDINAPELTSLSLRGCLAFPQLAVQAVVAQCSALKLLDVQR